MTKRRTTRLLLCAALLMAPGVWAGAGEVVAGNGSIVIKEFTAFVLDESAWAKPKQSGQGRTEYKCKSNEGCPGVIFLSGACEAAAGADPYCAAGSAVPFQSFDGEQLYFLCAEGSVVASQGQLFFLPEACEFGVPG